MQEKYSVYLTIDRQLWSGDDLEEFEENLDSRYCLGTFNTEEEAEAALNDHIKHIQPAADSGPVSR